MCLTHTCTKIVTLLGVESGVREDFTEEVTLQLRPEG